MKKLMVLFLLMLFFYYYAFSQSLLDVKSTIKESVDVTILFKYDDFCTTNSLFIPKLLYFNVFSNFVDTNRYIVVNFYDGGFVTFSFPVIDSFSNFVNAFESNEILSENTALISCSNEKLYIKKEGNYITFLDNRYMANYNSLSLLSVDSDYSRKLDLFLSKLSQNNVSGFFSYLQKLNLKNLKTGFKVIDDNYNILDSLDYVEGFISSNKVYGNVYLTSTSKSSKIYVPRAIRKLSLDVISEIRDVLVFSVNSSLFSDVVELLYPDIVSTFPSIKKEIVNTLSGTVGILYYGRDSKNKEDAIILVGTKSKSQGEKFLRSFLGLFKYKILNLSGNKVYEINFENEVIYLFMSDKEFVIATQLSRMQNYLNDLKKKFTNNYYSSFSYPTVYFDLSSSTLVNAVFQSFNFDVLALDSVNFYADIDDSLKVIEYSLLLRMK